MYHQNYQNTYKTPGLWGGGGGGVDELTVVLLTMKSVSEHSIDSIKLTFFYRRRKLLSRKWIGWEFRLLYRVSHET